MIITEGSTNVSVYFYVQQDAGGTSPGEPHTGMLFSDLTSASFARQGAARVAVTPITLANASAVHADGGFILVDDTNMPGLYRFDIPDAALVSGVDQVFIMIVPAGGQNATAAPLLIDLQAALATAAALAIVDAEVDKVVVATITNAVGADVSADIATLTGNQQSFNIPKNATFTDFGFTMVLTSDHFTAGTGLTVTGEKSINGGAYSGVTGSISEISDGSYAIDLSAADTNGDVIQYKFSAATADDTIMTVFTIT